MALSLTEYAQYLRGMAVGASGCRDISALVYDPASDQYDAIVLQDLGDPTLPVLAISRLNIERDEAEGMVLAVFGPKPCVPIVPDPVLHPVVQAIRNSKTAGVYRP